ncbi:MAG: uroporphyrinogen-III C-methyltransferase, partial [Anaerolineae bacterium]|nr:uroporphyrinogen-III C-methyltransferase [Anaerolineae bacterium]
PSVKQRDISLKLVDLAREGKKVLRLKGGDPFVFGRGGEEAQTLVQHGVNVRIIPGISAGIGGLAYAGIPVTHRGMVTSFAVVTGHEDPNKPESTTDWAALAQVPTLVMLMAAKNIARIRGELLAAGRAGETPAAAISWATTDRQQVVRTTLDKLPADIAAHKLPTPMIVVLGDVVTLHDKLAWFKPDGGAGGFVPYEAVEGSQ